MTRGHLRLPKPAATCLVVCGLLTVALLAGCDSDHTVCAPGVAAARLTGRVLTGGDPSSLDLVAEPVDLQEGETALYPAVPAADGSYAIDVPPGRYVLKLGGDFYVQTDFFYTAKGPAYGTMPPDTLVAENGRIYPNLDFDLGSLSVHVDLPDSLLGGERAMILLHREGTDGGSWDPEFRWQETATIAGDLATVTATGIPPGRYQVELVLGYRLYGCYCPWDGQHIWLPAGAGAPQATWYEVTAGTMTELTYAPRDASAHLSGRIGGAWLELGFDLEPEISLIGTDSTTIMGRRRVGADGSFDLVLYQPRPVKLLVTHQGMPQYIGGPDFAAATVFDPAPGEAISGIEAAPCAVTLDTSSPLDTSYGTGDFELYTADGRTLLGTVDGQIYFKSTYILPNLWPGEFLIRAVPQPGVLGRTWWIPQWYPGVTDPGEAETVTLTQYGEILPLSMTVLAGGSIAGDILDAPDPDAWWYALVTPADDSTIWGRNYIFGPQTSYQLVGIPDGRWKVGACLIHTATDTIWYSGTTDWDAAAVITIENGSTVEGIDIPVD